MPIESRMPPASANRRTIPPGLVAGVTLTRVLALALALASAACDHGLEPPELQDPGSIRGIVRYTGTWPAEPDVHDLRFVAMRFVPRDTADFLQLNLMAISTRLEYGVASDTFLVEDVDPGVFVYSGVAWQFTPNLLSWKPVGLYEDEGGIFDVEANRVTELRFDVDFGNLPPFPPPGN